MRHWVLISSLIALSVPRLGWACASCACGDPTLTSVGLDKPFKGRVRLSLQGRYRWEQTEQTDGIWHSDEIRTDLGVSWAVTDRVVLSATLPLTSAGLRAPNLAWKRGTGLGDGAIRARFVALRSASHKHLGGVTTGLEMPTAPRLSAEQGTVPQDAQPGDGAWTPELGLWYGGFFGMWSVFTSATARVSSTAWDERWPGTTALGTFATQVQPHDRVAVRASVDARWQDVDRIAGVVDTHSGGWLVQVAPALLFSPHTDVLITLGVAIPLASNLGGGAREGVAPSLGVVLDL